MARALKILSFTWALVYALFTVGVPVYQIHCSCSGETQTSVLVEPLSCETPQHSHHEQALEVCTHCHASTIECGTGACAAELADHHCDDKRVDYIVFDTLQEPTLGIAQIKVDPKVLDLRLNLITVTDQRIGKTLLVDVAKERSYVEAPPLCFSSSPDFLSFICQRKVPLTA